MTIQEYEQMMKAYDPELFVVRQELKELLNRGYGQVVCTWTIEAGKIRLLTREIKVTNTTDKMTDKIKLIY